MNEEATFIIPEHSLLITLPKNMYCPKMVDIFRRHLNMFSLPEFEWCRYTVRTTLTGPPFFTFGWLDAYSKIDRSTMIGNIFDYYDYVSGMRAAHHRFERNYVCVNS